MDSTSHADSPEEAIPTLRTTDQLPRRVCGEQTPVAACWVGTRVSAGNVAVGEERAVCRGWLGSTMVRGYHLLLG